MHTLIGFGSAILAAAVVALVLARGEPREEPLPWDIADMVRIQANLMATLGAVSITGLVLLVAVRSQVGSVVPERMDTAALMLAFAFGYFVQAAYSLSYLPGQAAGERLQRLCFAMVTTMQWRTVVLVSLALGAVAGIFGLPNTERVLLYMVPLMVLMVTLIIAAVSDALGLIRFGECLLTFLAGVLLGGLAAIVMTRLWPGARISVVVAAICYAGVGGPAYLTTALGSLAPRRPALHGFLGRHARRLAMFDMTATGVALAFLWIAVIGGQ